MNNFPKQLINEHTIMSLQVPGNVLGSQDTAVDQTPALAIL